MQEFLFFWDYKRNTSFLSSAYSEPPLCKAFLGTGGCVWCMAFLRDLRVYTSLFPADVRAVYWSGRPFLSVYILSLVFS